MNVLVVEDDKVNQNHIANIVSNLPVHVIRAKNGKEAINASGEVSPDCILMDYDLPGTEPWTLLDYFVNRQFPVIMVTDRNSDAIENNAMDIGAIGVLDKWKLSTQILRKYIQEASPDKKLYFKRTSSDHKKELIR